MTPCPVSSTVEASNEATRTYTSQLLLMAYCVSEHTLNYKEFYTNMVYSNISVYS